MSGHTASSFSSVLRWFRLFLRRNRSIQTVMYGVRSALGDEAQLVRNLNQFMKTHDAGKVAKMDGYETFNPEDGSRIPPRIEYYYSGNCGKAHPGWFFRLEPNVGLDGKAKVDCAADCAWLLYAGQRDVYNRTPGYHEVINEYIAGILASLSFPTRVLHTFKAGEYSS